jgi:hypothetical protein
MAKGTPKRRSGLNISPALITGVVMVALVAFGGFYFYQYNSLNNKYKELTLSQEEKNERDLAAVAKLIDLPKDEKPEYLSVIKDKKTLEKIQVTKSFFSSAQDGDIVIGYKKANTSIIYRPSTNKIIKTDNYTNLLAAAYPVAVAIVAPKSEQDTVESKIKSVVLNAEVVGKVEPKIGASSSYVADATGTNAKAAKDLADKLGLSVGALPEGEARPEGAALIVVVAPPAAPPAQ